MPFVGLVLLAYASRFGRVDLLGAVAIAGLVDLMLLPFVGLVLLAFASRFGRVDLLGAVAIAVLVGLMLKPFGVLLLADLPIVGPRLVADLATRSGLDLKVAVSSRFLNVRIVYDVWLYLN